MVVNYSKWDALELSDDSDIEVHPNVDKRSFIRAKQNQIHMERDKRRHEIKTLKYERIVNDGLLERIDSLLGCLKDHADQVTGANPDNFMMEALMDTAVDPSKDKPPEPPEGVHYKEAQPSYSEMMAGLVDQVKKEVGSGCDDWYKKYYSGVNEHRLKVQGLQKDLLSRLSELEKEEGSKITSESIHDGFNQSSVSKEKERPKEKPAGKSKPRAETVEVLNPGTTKSGAQKEIDTGGQSSGADADIDEPVEQAGDEDEDSVELTAVARKFGQIKSGDYRGSLQFISENREIMEEKNQDGLLMEAFNAQLEGRAFYAKQCVHQSLLIQYCRTLGKDGVGMFFKRITTPGHNAQKVFIDDVNSTYERIRGRTAEIKAEREANPRTEDESGGVEQIQLHAVEPGSKININVPQPNSTEEVEQQARIIFERFPPGLQRALESGSLDSVNEVLGKMSVTEAEEVVEQLGDAGMLSMEKGVIDGTTEEGQQKLKELEREAAEGQAGGEMSAEDGLAELNMQAQKDKDLRGDAIQVADPD